MGVPLDRVEEASIKKNTPDPELNKLAIHSSFGKVDCFFSHSWRDNGDLKWRAIQEFRDEFNALRHREPIVWIDKYCIDQTNIDENLKCLPMSLAGCKGLTIFLGETYLTRLWCLIGEAEQEAVG